LAWIARAVKRKKASASFLKKRRPARGSKKLPVLRALALPVSNPAVSESFLLLFFKKEALSS